MKDKTRALLKEIDDAHDWNLGQTYGGTGMRLSRTDTCAICNLRRHWSSDVQNGNRGTYRFSDGETDQDLSLRQAAARECYVEKTA